MRREQLAQIVRFLCAGGTTVAVDFGTFYLCNTILQTPLFVATSLSYGAGFITSFLLNKLWVFDSQTETRRETLRELLAYAVLFIFNLGASYVMIYGLIHLFDVHPLVAKFISIIAITIWNFVLYKKVIFIGGARERS